MKIWTFLTLIYLPILFVLFFVPKSVIADTQINVPVKIQEHSNWCWAASSEAVLSYYGKSISQCDMASQASSYAPHVNCCGNSTYNWNDQTDDCNSGKSLYESSRILYNAGVSFDNSGSSNSSLSQVEIVAAIDSKQPFIMSWGWTSGGGHELVGYGYDQNGLYLDYVDPLPGHGYTKSLYSWVVNAPDHNWRDTLKTLNIGPPTGVSATAGNTNATIHFTTPAQNSGGWGTITYTVTSSPGNIIAVGTSNWITVTGLTNGTAYTFTVTASNAIGTSQASLPSNSVTPFTVPGAPNSVSATSGIARATISFTAPTYNGDSPITSYSVRANPGSIYSYGATSPITVMGLTGGIAYNFTVTANNAAGSGPASSPSNSVTPTSTVPSAPANVIATAGNAQATVSFWTSVPNGSPITSYTVTSNPGNIAVTGTASPLTLTGLTNGTAYTFSATATNAVGTSQASSLSNSVVPFTVPGIPSNVTASAGLAQATVSFLAPASNGSPITTYTVTSSPGNIIATGSTSPITVMGLTGGKAYTFTVAATNVAGGTGLTSSPSNSVIPTFTVPGKPTGVYATAGNAPTLVYFNSPTSNGNPITSYTVTSSPGNITATGVASPIVVWGQNGLINGTSYTFTVTATNAAGAGPASTPSNSVIPLLAYYPVPAFNTWGLLTTVGALALLPVFRRKGV